MPYVYLVCEEGKEFICLGKMLMDPNSNSPYFHLGAESPLPLSENRIMMKTIIKKFFATHMSRVIRVVPEDEFDRLYQDDFVRISLSGDAAVKCSDYTRGFIG